MTQRVLKMNEHFLIPNRSIEDKFVPLIKKYIPDCQTLDFVNIKIMEQNDEQTVYIKFYCTKKWNQTGWNNEQKLMEMKFTITANNQVNLLYLNDDVNAIDTGAIIPQISDLWQNWFQRPRNWNSQRRNWNEFKKDWDVTWSDKPYHRH